MQIGKKIFIKDSVDIAENYLKTAQNDENAAILLMNQKFYNQAAYFFIQAMEKYIKHRIADRINVLNKYFADEINKTMGHSLDKSLELLVNVYAGNDKILFEQINQQLRQHVLKDLNFRFLNNSLRYPIYNAKFGNYMHMVLNESDCDKIKSSLDALKIYLEHLR